MFKESKNVPLGANNERRYGPNQSGEARLALVPEEILSWKNALEVGPGDGRAMKDLKDKGIPVTGIEPNASNLTSVHKELGVDGDIVNATANQAAAVVADKGPFDAAYAIGPNFQNFSTNVPFLLEQISGVLDVLSSDGTFIFELNHSNRYGIDGVEYNAIFPSDPNTPVKFFDLAGFLKSLGLQSKGIDFSIESGSQGPVITIRSHRSDGLFVSDLIREAINDGTYKEFDKDTEINPTGEPQQPTLNTIQTESGDLLGTADVISASSRFSSVRQTVEQMFGYYLNVKGQLVMTPLRKYFQEGNCLSFNVVPQVLAYAVPSVFCKTSNIITDVVGTLTDPPVLTLVRGIEDLSMNSPISLSHSAQPNQPKTVELKDVSKVSDLYKLPAGYSFTSEHIAALDTNNDYLKNTLGASDEDIQDVNQKVTAWLRKVDDESGFLSQDIPMVKKLQAIVDGMQEKARALSPNTPQPKLRVLVAANDSSENAYALPDGTIVVTWALINMYKGTPETPGDIGELAGILLHERNHIVYGHHQILNNVRKSAVDFIERSIAGKGLSRLFEYEADLRDFELLMHLGFDPRVHVVNLMMRLINSPMGEGADVVHGTEKQRLAQVLVMLKKIDLEHIRQVAIQNGVSFAPQLVPDTWMPIAIYPNKMEVLTPTNRSSMNQDWVTLYKTLKYDETRIQLASTLGVGKTYLGVINGDFSKVEYIINSLLEARQSEVKDLSPEQLLLYTMNLFHTLSPTNDVSLSFSFNQLTVDKRNIDERQTPVLTTMLATYQNLMRDKYAFFFTPEGRDQLRQIQSLIDGTENRTSQLFEDFSSGIGTVLEHASYAVIYPNENQTLAQEYHTVYEVLRNTLLLIRETRTYSDDAITKHDNANARYTVIRYLHLANARTNALFRNNKNIDLDEAGNVFFDDIDAFIKEFQIRNVSWATLQHFTDRLDDTALAYFTEKIQEVYPPPKTLPVAALIKEARTTNKSFDALLNTISGQNEALFTSNLIVQTFNTDPWQIDEATELTNEDIAWFINELFITRRIIPTSLRSIIGVPMEGYPKFTTYEEELVSLLSLSARLPSPTRYELLHAFQSSREQELGAMLETMPNADRIEAERRILNTTALFLTNNKFTSAFILEKLNEVEKKTGEAIENDYSFSRDLDNILGYNIHRNTYEERVSALDSIVTSPISIDYQQGLLALMNNTNNLTAVDIEYYLNLIHEDLARVQSFVGAQKFVIQPDYTEVAQLKTLYGFSPTSSQYLHPYNGVVIDMVTSLTSRLQQVLNESEVDQAQALYLVNRITDLAAKIPDQKASKQLIQGIEQLAITFLQPEYALSFFEHIFLEGIDTNVDLFQSYVQTHVNDKKDLRSMNERIQEDYAKFRTKDSKALTGVAYADMILSNIGPKRVDAVKLFTAITNGDDEALRALLAPVWYAQTATLAGHKYYALNTNNGLQLTGPGIVDFVPFNTFMEQLYSLSPSQKQYVLSRLLLEKILDNTDNKEQLMTYLRQQLDASKDTTGAGIIDDIMVSLFSNTPSVYLVAPLVDVFAPHAFIRPEKTDNTLAADQYDPHGFAGQVVYAFNSGYQREKSTTLHYQASFYDAKDDKDIFLQLLNLDERNYQYSSDVRQLFQTATDEIVTQLGVAPETTAQQGIDQAESITPIRLAMRIAESHSLGVRLLQVLGYYMNIPEHLRKEFSTVYDKAAGMNKIEFWTQLESLAAYDPENTGTFISDTPPQKPGDTRLVKINDQIGAGSIVTVYTVLIDVMEEDGSISQREAILKLRNQNAESFMNTMIGIIDSILADMTAHPEQFAHIPQNQLPRFQLLLNSIIGWLREDMNDISYQNIHPYFQHAIGNMTASNGVHVTVGKNYSLHNDKIKLEYPAHDISINEALGMAAQGKIDHLPVQYASEAVAESFWRMSTVTEKDDNGNDWYIMHSNYTPGNVFMKRDGSSIEWIDNSYPQTLSEKQAEVVRSVARGGGIMKLVNIINAVFNLPENKNRSSKLFTVKFLSEEAQKYGGSMWKIFSLRNVSEEDIALDLFIAFRDAGVVIPREVELGIYNVGAINKTLQNTRLQTTTADYAPGVKRNQLPWTKEVVDNVIQPLKDEVENCEITFRNIPHIYADAKISSNVLGVTTGTTCRIPLLLVPVAKNIVSFSSTYLWSPPIPSIMNGFGTGGYLYDGSYAPPDNPPAILQVKSEGECKTTYDGCYIRAEDQRKNGQFVNLCVPNRRDNASQRCCNGTFFAGECIELKPFTANVLNQTSPKWQNIAANSNCEDVRVVANRACGPFSVAGILQNFNGEIFTPEEMQGFIETNYPGGICNGTIFTDQLTVLSRYPNITTHELFRHADYSATKEELIAMKEFLLENPGAQILVGGTFNGIKHFALIIGVNSNNEFIFSDSFFDKYSVFPSLFEAVGVTRNQLTQAKLGEVCTQFPDNCQTGACTRAGNTYRCVEPACTCGYGHYSIAAGQGTYNEVTNTCSLCKQNADGTCSFSSAIQSTAFSADYLTNICTAILSDGKPCSTDAQCESKTCTEISNTAGRKIKFCGTANTCQYKPTRETCVQSPFCKFINNKCIPQEDSLLQYVQ